jgi:hypothetical protein
MGERADVQAERGPLSCVVRWCTISHIEPFSSVAHLPGWAFSFLKHTSSAPTLRDGLRWSWFWNVNALNAMICDELLKIGH